MLFETDGWTLPTSIKPSKGKDPKTGQETTQATEEQQRSATREADRLQHQIKQLANKDTGKNKAKNQPKRDQQQQQQQQQKKQKKQQPNRPIDNAHTDVKNANKPKKQQQQTKRPAEEPLPTAPAKKAKVENTQQQQKNKKREGNEHTSAETGSAGVDSRKPAAPAAVTKTSKAAKKRQQKQQLQELLGKSAPGKKHQHQQQQQQQDSEDNKQPAQQPQRSGSKLTALQQKMKDKLSGARFRWLNEQLYTTKGDDSFKLFQEKPELFDEYHEGFRHQVESWPENPVDLIVSQLEKLPAGTIVADLGCGDAKIAHTLKRQKVMSFDMVAKNDKVIACDIAKLPLPNDFVDVAVFSLALMGTNYLEFLKEAHRVLKPGGELKIAEVISRFSDVDAFINLLEQLGYDFMDKDDNNKMFIMLYFTKREIDIDNEIDQEMLQGLSKKQKRSLRKGAGLSVSAGKLQKKAESLLKPCVYKKR